MQNYRNNAPGSRRSPLDLENPAQYAIVDEYRNNAYGLYNRDDVRRRAVPRVGWPGRQRAVHQSSVMYRENRLIGKANLDWQFDRYNRLKLGGEFTHYDIDSYSHQLESQAFSDVYHGEADPLERCSRKTGSTWATWSWSAALRYDFYDTRAAPLERLPPDLDQSGCSIPTIRTRSSPTTRSFPKDQSHNYLSPHVQVSFPVTERTNFRLSYAHQVQAPDFGVMLQGINTDIAITNTNNFYGADLDFGKYHHLRVRGAARLQRRHGAGRGRVQQGQPVQRRRPSGLALRSAPGQQPEHPDHDQRRLRQHPRRRRAARPAVRQPVQRHPGLHLPAGQEHRLRSRHLPRLRLPGAQPGLRRQPASAAGDSADRLQPAAQPGRGRRRSTSPTTGSRDRSSGPCCENVGVFATFRYTSGTPYTRCEPGVGDEDVVSGDNCDNALPRAAQQLAAARRSRTWTCGSPRALASAGWT